MKKAIEETEIAETKSKTIATSGMEMAPTRAIPQKMIVNVKYIPLLISLYASFYATAALMCDITAFDLIFEAWREALTSASVALSVFDKKESKFYLVLSPGIGSAGFGG